MSGAFVVLAAILGPAKQIQVDKAASSTPISVNIFFQNKGVVRAFSGAFFLMFSQGVLAYMLPFKVVHLGFYATTSGLSLSTFDLVAILVFILPINHIFDRVKPIKRLAFGMGFMGVS
ncbi:hypothetical protein ACFVR1_09030 [Psychrobacillus sp. NPDC058041]|uniref:hypothetical protein n=1 Tax=Psychrobacillus sp. NPDC058041 TaxID=3346310 RepID=UPI0036DA1BB4